MGRARAWAFDALLGRFERSHGQWLREPTLAAARGRVLEIGGGTGANLPYYPAAVRELVVTEPDGAMLERARRRPAARLAADLVEAPMERLPFAEATFDTVVCTLVLCSAGDLSGGLAEVGRVLAPGGELLFVEHVRSDDPALARLQDRLERPWRMLAHGCRPNRDTVALLRASGYAVTIERRGELPAGPRIVRPFVAGRARPLSA